MIYVAFFRGVNVGGKNPLPMKELVKLLESQGFQGVRTYIQSGNVVFASADADRTALAHTIVAAVDARFGFSPVLALVTAYDLERVIAANPFPAAVDEPTTLHVAFLGEHPATDGLDKLAAMTGPTEQWRLIGQALYFWAPAGFGTSKFPTSVERLLGVAATFRNWRTVVTMRDLVREAGGGETVDRPGTDRGPETSRGT
jgi:uncharacterized protein (DUF1697 family)